MGLIILIGVVLHLVIKHVSPFVFGDAGAFYMINEGFSPKNFENKFVKFETCLEPTKENYLDKRMYGVFTIKKKSDRIGVETQFYVKSNQQWLRQGPVWKFDNICTMPYRLGSFEKCFSGKFDKETCSLDKGTYYLRNYTMEDDIKSATDGKFAFGHYKITLTMEADVEGKREKALTSNYSMHIKDEKNKQSEVRLARNKKMPRCDRYENKV